MDRAAGLLLRHGLAPGELRERFEAGGYNWRDLGLIASESFVEPVEDWEPPANGGIPPLPKTFHPRTP